MIRQRHTILLPLLSFIMPLSLLANESSTLGKPAPQGTYIEGQVIVKLKGSASSDASQKFFGKMQKPGSGFEVKKSWGSLNIHQIHGKSGQSTDALIQQMSQDSEVEYVEPDYILGKQGDVESQSYTMEQVRTFVSGFGLTNTNVIHGVEGWALATGSGNPTVAVIDTGVDMYHEALEDAIWVNPGESGNDQWGQNKATNGRDDDGNGFVDDVNGWDFKDNSNFPFDCDGHGTHVAGIIRGTTQDIFSDPIAAPKVKIMALRFLDCNGFGSTSAAISAIYYAVNNGARVLNNSWGGGNYSRALHEAIIYSYNRYTLFVAAAGNSAANNDSAKTYPASYDVPNIISVAATDDYDRLAWFSNYGSSSVHVAAPGLQILSTYSSQRSLPNSFVEQSGTSMAAPFVAGVAALIANEQPAMTGYQIKKIILQEADRISGLSGKVSTGARLNSQESVTFAKTATLDSSQPPYYMQINSDDRELAGALAGSGAGCGLVQKLNNGGKGGGNGGTPFGLLFLLSGLLALPFWIYQKLKEVPQHRRNYQRYKYNAPVQIHSHGQQLTAELNTISVGGAGLSVSQKLEHGSELTLQIMTPEGRELEVTARVVWSTESNQYGLKFSEDSRDEVQDVFAPLFHKLIKT